MFLSKKFEAFTLCLFAASLLSLVAFHGFPRTEVISPANQVWVSEAVGNSALSPGEKDFSETGIYELEFDSQPQVNDPFAMLWLRPTSVTWASEDVELGTLDLRWASQISITSRVVGEENANFRLQFRNYSPKNFQTDDQNWTSFKYNEAYFCATDQWQTTNFDRGTFSVPGWWADSYAIDSEDAISDFSKIKWIEVSTGTHFPCGSVKLQVREIKLSGHWIQPVLFYRCLLGCWMSLGLAVLYSALKRQRDRLQSVDHERKQLYHLNDSLRAQAETYSSLAKIDSLTGLVNRRGAKERVKEIIEKSRQHDHLAMIMFDIDDFKVLNDTQGHVAGDRVLSNVGEICNSVSTDDFMVARWGGEEFLGFCAADSKNHAIVLTQHLRELFKSETGITCSFGIHYLQLSETFDEAIGSADCALYQAKHGGKDCVEVFKGSASVTPPLVFNNESQTMTPPFEFTNRQVALHSEKDA